MPRFTYRSGDTTYTLDLDPQPDGGWLARLDGQSVSVQTQPQPDGGWRLLVDGVATTVYAAAHGDQRSVWHDGAHYTLETVRAGGRSRGRSTAARSGRLTAQMPGQVRMVLVAAGDSVTRGQTLVILEAMKMELRVAAPADGVVRQVHVQVGAVVERDALLVEIE
ncbi:MAG: biotin/lipoyl-containing protein [Chloroflexota bacterium]|nr:biotin/lipoyl-containing protein [Chloroflexota bacterium]